MKKVELLKSILIPTLGISAIGSIAVVSTSCEKKKPAVVPVTGVKLDKASVTLGVGDTEKLTATVLPENATNKDVTWTSSDTNVATVDSNGTITAKAKGTATVIVTTHDGGKTATCAVNVDTIPVTGVKLDKTFVTLAVGETETLTATVLPETATDKIVAWSSSNPSVAIVENGVITPKGLGNATITVISHDGGFTATCEVNVDAIRVASVTLNKTSINLTAEGQTETLTATVLPETATDQSVTWSSSNTNVATVEDGVVTVKGLGNATITVTTNDGGKTANCRVTVGDLIPYVVITANEDSTLTLNNVAGNDPDLQYSTNGTNWNTYSTSINITKNKNLYLKGNNPNGWSHGSLTYSALSFVGDVSIYGNVMALLDNGAKPGEQGDITGIPCDSCFYNLFQISTGITSVSKNFLPATSLANNCYQNMFYGCSSLTTAPILPATTLTENCYRAMFGFCSSLTTAPDLPATTLTDRCYYGMFENCKKLEKTSNLPATVLNNSCYESMFQGCISLKTAPKLPATTLANSCYFDMFLYCSSLTTAPALPATTLVRGCYSSMFSGCSSLTTAPDLPATTLAEGCYYGMFYDCSSLNSIKIDYTGNYDSNYFSHWVDGVASSGTFYYNGSQTAQDFQLPSGWIVYYNCEFTRILANMNSTLELKNEGANNPNLQYSTDGTNWTTYSAPINIPQGQSLYLKGNNSNGWSYSSVAYSALFITGDVSIAGNIMGLLDNGAKTGEQGDITAIPCDSCFYNLFQSSTGITSVSKNFLPATSLANNCYQNMFYGCSSLTTAPILPATTLTANCYRAMFGFCSSLTTAPDLPATTLATECCRFMFQGCSSLTTAPDLPATTLEENCYYGMFYDCSSLTTAPNLPATILVNSCYQNMFSGCSSLTTAPNLPATTLTENCYRAMFEFCSSLTTAPKLPATTLADNCYRYMFQYCSSLTTAPDLPATTLEENCYYGMFHDCSSLTTVPELPATILAYGCYYVMFHDCSSLNSIKIDYTGNYDSNYFSHWVDGVASSGTFYYNGSSQTAQEFQFPEGWTVEHF